MVLNQKVLEEIRKDHPKNSQDELEKITSQFVENVEKNIESFSYNKIIANFHEVYSAINKIINNKFDKECWIKNYKNVLIAMSPVIPHFSNECIEKLDLKSKESPIFWPKINKNILVSNMINFIIQINGKTRGIMNIKTELGEKQILKKIKENEKIKKYIEGKLIKKQYLFKIIN